MSSIPRVRSIAIVGAGPSGLATAKYLIAEKCFQRIDILEHRRDVGGVWNYEPDASETIDGSVMNDSHSPRDASRRLEESKSSGFVSPMYEGLETNIPRCLMEFSDQRFPTECQLFPSQITVLEYLNRYARDVLHMIRFSTLVLDIQPTIYEETPCWMVRTKENTSKEHRVQIYDAVVIASGHYNVPFTPDLCGLQAWKEAYPESLIHSRDYHRVEPFRNKRSTSYLVVGPEEFKEDVPEISEFIVEGRAVRFTNGRLEYGVDVVLFCTGYSYCFPFLSTLSPPLVTDGTRTEHVYKQIFYSPRPTLAFSALPQKIVPFPTAECQAAVIARVWSHRLQLPCERAMEDWEESVIREHGNGKRFHILNFPRDVEYINELHDWSVKATTAPVGKVPPRWSERTRWTRERFPAIKKAFVDKGEERHTVRHIEDLGFVFDA
ncbi:MAG: hypothetical protein M1833_001536 [Piccolia ochrophora]|nr:MAG: hypothetical protein M1833_001536 [Piccolia ochrophora]